MGPKKTFPAVFFVVTLLGILFLSYYISGLFLDETFSVLTWEESLAEILLHPQKNYWNEKSFPCLLAGFLIWVYIVTSYLYHNRNFMFGREHGSAQWEDVRRLRKGLADKDPNQNRIVSANLEYSFEALPNNNMIVVGSPGMGKSTFVVIPNLLLMCSSYTILDVKGDLLYGYGSFLKAHGYQVKVLNLKEKAKSDCYNPFFYIKKEEDIIKLIANIQESTTPPDSMKGEPFWDHGVEMYLQALFFYVYYEFPKEKQTMAEVMKLVRYEAEILDGNGTTRLSLLMQNLAFGKRGKEHPAYTNYMKLKGGAPETVASIILIVNTKLQLFEIPEVKRIFEDDTLDLKSIGIGRHGDEKTKTALFLVVPDNDTSFHFIVNMLYTQLIDTLLEEADEHYHGKLPIRVELFLDEYGTGARPYRFEVLANSLRSRNIAAVLFLQSISQLKTIHKGEGWNVLMDACSAFVFLGAGRGALDTHKYIADLLGQATIDKRSEGENRGLQGSSSLNYDRMGRELMSAAEIGKMKKEDCIVLLAGYGPVYDRKNKPFRQKRFLEAQAMPRYEHPIFCRKKENGEYLTLKAEGSFEKLSPKSVEYYRKLQEQGENVRFYTLDEQALLQMEFLEGEIDLIAISRFFLEHQKELEELERNTSKETD